MNLIVKCTSAAPAHARFSSPGLDHRAEVNIKRLALRQNQKIVIKQSKTVNKASNEIAYPFELHATSGHIRLGALRTND
jgi:hypothetical protein